MRLPSQPRPRVAIKPAGQPHAAPRLLDLAELRELWDHLVATPLLEAEEAFDTLYAAGAFDALDQMAAWSVATDPEGAPVATCAGEPAAVTVAITIPAKAVGAAGEWVAGWAAVLRGRLWLLWQDEGGALHPLDPDQAAAVWRALADLAQTLSPNLRPARQKANQSLERLHRLGFPPPPASA